MSTNLPTPLLEAKAVAKHFGGVKALRDVSLTIRHGEIYGLIGPNGAGKTTFFNCMTGLYVPDGGGFTFDGAPLVADAPQHAAARGIARTFQNIRLFGNMTALENVMVGRHVRTRAGVIGAMLNTSATRAEEAAIRQRARQPSAPRQPQLRRPCLRQRARLRLLALLDQPASPTTTVTWSRRCALTRSRMTTCSHWTTTCPPR